VNTAQSIMHRLASTVRDNGKSVHRIRDILTQPFRARHITNFVKGSRLVDGEPFFDAQAFWSIKQGGLLVSTGGTAVFGDGAYCFSVATPPPTPWHYYVDILVPPVTGCEQMKIPGIAPYYYRFLPAMGDRIPVTIIGTNIPGAALSMAQNF